MLETSARLLRLLSLLQTPREWTGAELADRLAVSTRTVRNDVERLRALGYPVNANRGATGGYRLGAGAALPPLLLDDEEAVAVAIGLRTAAAGSITGVEETSLRALAKLEQVLPSRLRRRVNTLHTYAVRVPADDAGPRVSAEVLTVIAAACRDREQLRFDYRAHDDSESRRVVEPYRLVNWGRRWYLVAWDVQRGDWRTFRVDRVTPRTPTGPRFAARDVPEDLTARVRHGVSSAAWRYRASVTVRAPAEVVAERINPAVGTVEAVDDETCVLHTGADTVASLAVHIGLLDADFTVDGPPELVDHLRVLADRYRRAGNTGGPSADPVGDSDGRGAR
ncbi:helix-turn-helix transcriptional regulator [Actinokineospora fastidiosa]|uniref:DNA-binding transcriptional regulator n=1 Tax=Actinokineospora fastidiosa TaxID=1816 RepID=A0A918G3T6_9PSEU|nr:YafY family protein [Actinokineospora fastidiosa]GGS17636.1 DNA-binding transcriptional regulator [Actinokineospora fastidiosa]